MMTYIKYLKRVEIVPKNRTKITYILISLFLAIGFVSVSIAFVGSQKKSRGNEKITSKETVTLEKALALDSDGDGFPDWEEILAGSDPFDPLDTPETITTDRLAGAHSVNSPKTLTDVFSRQIFSSFIATRNSGQVLSQDAIEQMTGSFLQINQDPPKPYSTQDIRVVSTVAESVRSYINAVGVVVEEINSHEGDTEIFFKFAETQNYDTFSKLEDLSNALKRASDSLLLVNTPNELALSHLSLINNINTAAYYMSIASRSFPNDTLMFLSSFAKYQEHMDAATSVFSIMRSYASKYRLIFESYEGGSIIVNI